jgi:hypothetical protein
MIEWSKMNERLPDMTPNRMLLDVNLSRLIADWSVENMNPDMTPKG